VFGRRPLLLSALVFFTVGAFVGGFAHNYPTLLTGRALQGIGGGGILVLTEIIVTDMIPLRERGKWFGFISMAWAIGITNLICFLLKEIRSNIPIFDNRKRNGPCYRRSLYFELELALDYVD
jgi:MFS family permease